MKTLTVHNKIPARILKRNKMIFKNVFLGCSLAALTFLFLFFSPQSKAASSGKSSDYLSVKPTPPKQAAKVKRAKKSKRIVTVVGNTPSISGANNLSNKGNQSVEADGCPEETDKYVSKEGHFYICFWERPRLIKAEDYLKTGADNLDTKIGKLTIHDVRLNSGLALYAASWTELPKQYKNKEEITRLIADLNYQNFELSDKSVVDETGNEVGKWYRKKECSGISSKNLFCVKERIYIDGQMFYRIAVWRNNIDENSPWEMENFERHSETFFNSFKISARQQ